MKNPDQDSADWIAVDLGDKQPARMGNGSAKFGAGTSEQR